MARHAFCPSAGKIPNVTKAAALVWQLRTALVHQPRACSVFSVLLVGVMVLLVVLYLHQ